MSDIPRGVPSVFGDERTCDGCGYSLRGLEIGSDCPECGRPSSRSSLPDNPLSAAPRSVVERLALGGLIATGAMLVLIAARFLDDPRISSLVGLGAATGWFVAAVLLTPIVDDRTAMLHGFGPGARLAPIARWLQLAWPAHATLFVLAAWGGFAVPPLLVGVSWATVIAVVVYSVVLRRLAEWARDDAAARAFNLAAFAIPVCEALMYVDLEIISVFGRLLAIPSWLAVPYGVLSLSRSMRWTLRHAGQHEERERRRRERAEAADASFGARMDEIDRSQSG